MQKPAIIAVSATIGLMLIMPGGCRRQPASALSPADREAFRTSSPSPIKNPENPSTLLAAGTLPLICTFGPGGSIRILDVTTREPLLGIIAERDVMIVVHQEAGISVGGQKLRSGPLPADHRYEVWWDARQAQLQPLAPSPDAGTAPR